MIDIQDIMSWNHEVYENFHYRGERVYNHINYGKNNNGIQRRRLYK